MTFEEELKEITWKLKYVLEPMSEKEKAIYLRDLGFDISKKSRTEDYDLLRLYREEEIESHTHPVIEAICNTIPEKYRYIADADIESPLDPKFDKTESLYSLQERYSKLEKQYFEEEKNCRTVKKEYYIAKQKYVDSKHSLNMLEREYRAVERKCSQLEKNSTENNNENTFSK